MHSAPDAANPGPRNQVAGQAVVRPRYRAALALLLLIATGAAAQPRFTGGGVQFTFSASDARTVALVGDFNGWSKDEDPLLRDTSGIWSIIRVFGPGFYQYLFLVDANRYEPDALNPALIDNFDRSAKNSVFVLTDDHRILLTNNPPRPRQNPSDVYPVETGKKPVYLNIVWHQHQPLYVNPDADQLTGPWVRTHATKDYYDMAAMLRNYPNLHCTINLTSSLLHQLTTYYVDRLGPYVDTKNNRVDVKRFWKRWKGKTDPWIDLALKPTGQFDNTDKDYLYRNPWNAFGTNQVMLDRFPEYLGLKQKIGTGMPPQNDVFTEQELREIKFWFYLAHFDPDFLLGPVVLPDRSVCDLSDYVKRGTDGKFTLRRRITEEDCNRIIAEAYKVMASIIPIHRELKYDPVTTRGQIEIITTPYDHPILPLIYDSDVARICQPHDSLPPRFSYPQDAEAQVAKAVVMYTGIFGVPPTGMWPGEGALSQAVLGVLRKNGILWTATDVKVLMRSDPPSQPNTTPYLFPAGADSSITVVFRDTDLSDRIGFKYQSYRGEEAAEDFVQAVLRSEPHAGAPDVLITVILDGENAWEWYRFDMDGKDFLQALYRKLSRLQSERRILTVTPTEYMRGNPSRGIPAHPAASLPTMKSIWPGSWINANYDTWIGEQEENIAWSYLLKARKDLGRSDLQARTPHAKMPPRGTRDWYASMAWEEMYAAEGSDWFWWYGNDQTAPGGDVPFDVAYRTHLRNIYRFANLAGADLAVPEFAPIITEGSSTGTSQGTMAQSRTEMQSIIFTCDATAIKVPKAVYIAGNLPQLGDWTPNMIAMHDDGTSGDHIAGDGIWTLTVDVPVGTRIEYKYTNSGNRGEWIPTEEFPVRNRSITIDKKATQAIPIHDIFGK